MEIIKDKYVWDDSHITYLLYDIDNYEFEFYEEENNNISSKSIIVKRLRDDKIIKIFNKKISFIYQSYKDYYNEEDIKYEEKRCNFAVFDEYQEKRSNFAVCEEYQDGRNYLSNYCDLENGLVFTTGMEIDDSSIEKLFANYHMYGKDKKRKSR